MSYLNDAKTNLRSIAAPVLALPAVIWFTIIALQEDRWVFWLLWGTAVILECFSITNAVLGAWYRGQTQVLREWKTATEEQMSMLDNIAEELEKLHERTGKEGF